jgi:hypothetical protein
LEEQNKLKFGDFDSESDLTKKIDGEIQEVTEDNKLVTKQADLYKNELYTIVPKGYDFTLGIYPDDQQLSHSSVILWNNIKTIPTSAIGDDYKVLKVKMNDVIIKNQLKPLGSGIYSLKHISPEVMMEEVDQITYNNE